MIEVNSLLNLDAAFLVQ